MTTEQVAEHRFAWIAEKNGPAVDWADQAAAHRHRVTGDGLVAWFSSDSGDSSKSLSLSKHVDAPDGELMLEIRPAYSPKADNDAVHWSSTLKVGADRYVRASGAAADFPSALAQCEAHQHASRSFGGLKWWQASEHRWVSWLGGFELSATRVSPAGSDSHWHYQVSGRAQTLEEAALLASLGRVDVVGAPEK